MQSIVQYLIDKYHPLAIIKYGSYCNGTNTASSDYDALVITDNKSTGHESSIVCNIQLDVFIYTASQVQDTANIDKLLGVYDGVILLDTDNLAHALVERIRHHIDNWHSSYDDDLFAVQWCDKMLARAHSNTAEGFYRWHWVLTDSLEMYMSLCDCYYFGCKKALNYLQQHDQVGFNIYTQALMNFQLDTLSNWITHIKEKFTSKYN